MEVAHYGGHEFPVGIVAQIEHHGVPLGGQTVYQLATLDGDAAVYLGIRDMQQLDGLDKVVGELAVEVVLDLSELGLGFLGERVAQVVAYHLAAIFQHPLQHETRTAAQRMQHRGGQQGQRGEGRVIERVFQTFAHIASIIALATLSVAPVF